MDILVKLVIEKHKGWNSKGQMNSSTETLLAAQLSRIYHFSKLDLETKNNL